MDEIDIRRIAAQARERQAAKDILKDPQSDQISRDLAHLRLQHEEGSKGYKWCMENIEDRDHEDCPDEWLAVEAFEFGLLQLSDRYVVAMVEDPLLRNKCNVIRYATGPDGKKDVFLAYPKLIRAVKHQLGSSSSSEKASANAVMACMKRANCREGALEYFRKAIRLRPKDWRLRNAIASSYMTLGNTSLSLEALNQACELTDENSIDRFEVESCRGKVLFKLGRLKEAKPSFMRVLVDAERNKDEWNLTAREKGHLIVTEYMLTIIWTQEKNYKMIKHQWDAAEKKRDALPVQIRKGLDWDARFEAVTGIRIVWPDVLSHLECHNCRQLCYDPKKCARCKTAFYCNQDCQRAHWKAGHKQECQTAKTARKAEKKQVKENVKKWESSENLPQLDATLDPWDLWAKAKKLAKDPRKASDSVFYFVVALFLDFSLDGEGLGPAQEAVEAADPKHPLSLALMMVTTRICIRDTMVHMESNHKQALEYFESCEEDMVLTHDDYQCKTIDQLHRARFGLAMCMLFRARILGRCFSVTSAEQARSDETKAVFAHIVELIADARQHLPIERWLTLQYECGYSNFDVGAGDEARRWLQTVVENLATLQKNDGKLTKHWKKMKKNATAKLRMLPRVQSIQREGAV